MRTSERWREENLECGGARDFHWSENCDMMRLMRNGANVIQKGKDGRGNADKDANNGRVHFRGRSSSLRICICFWREERREKTCHVCKQSPCPLCLLKGGMKSPQPKRGLKGPDTSRVKLFTKCSHVERNDSIKKQCGITSAGRFFSPLWTLGAKTQRLGFRMGKKKEPKLPKPS